MKNEKIVTSIAQSNDFSKKYEGVLLHCFKPSIISISQSANSHNIGTLTPNSSVSENGWFSSASTIITAHYGNVTGCQFEPPKSYASDYIYILIIFNI